MIMWYSPKISVVKTETYQDGKLSTAGLDIIVINGLAETPGALLFIQLIVHFMYVL